MGHLVASTRSLTVPCSDRASHSHYGFAFHSRRNGNYSRSADIPCTGRTGDRLHRLPHRRPFRLSLIGLHYSAVRQRRLGLHRFDDSPLSPNDDAKHPNSQRGYTVLLPSRRPNPGGLHLNASLKRRRLARHSGQCATLRSNAGWPLRYARFLRRTGCVPPERTCL